MIQIFILVLYIYIYLSIVCGGKKLEVRGEAGIVLLWRKSQLSVGRSEHAPPALDSISVFHLLAALSAFCSAFKAGN